GVAERQLTRRVTADVSHVCDSRWRFRMVWIRMVVLGTLLLACDSFKRATAPWWATWLGNGLMILGVTLPFLVAPCFYGIRRKDGSIESKQRRTRIAPAPVHRDFWNGSIDLVPARKHYVR